jgi:FkbM family methyltransferase
MTLGIARVAGHSFLLKPLRQPGAIAIDGGANLGAFARPLARRCRVVCVEPLPALAQELAAAGFAVEQVALAAANGRARLELFQGTCASLAAEGRNDRVAAVEVETVTLERLLQRQGLQRVALLKLDIEGPESAILLEAPAALLARLDQITVEFHDFLYPHLAPDVDRALARMQSLGFDCFRFSRDRSDVLFVNRRRWPLGRVERWLLRGPYRLGRGSLRWLVRATPLLRRLRGGWHERNY